jgi:hypothetical protein
MNPGSSGYVHGVLNPDVQQWLTWAGEYYGTVDLSNYEVVTNCGPLTLTGQVQEFIIQTPEPGTLALLLCGLLALAVGLLNRGQLAT